MRRVRTKSSVAGPRTWVLSARRRRAEECTIRARSRSNAVRARDLGASATHRSWSAAPARGSGAAHGRKPSAADDGPSRLGKGLTRGATPGRWGPRPGVDRAVAVDVRGAAPVVLPRGQARAGVRRTRACVRRARGARSSGSRAGATASGPRSIQRSPPRRSARLSRRTARACGTVRTSRRPSARVVPRHGRAGVLAVAPLRADLVAREHHGVPGASRAGRRRPRAGRDRPEQRADARGVVRAEQVPLARGDLPRTSRGEPASSRPSRPQGGCDSDGQPTRCRPRGAATTTRAG